MGAILQGCGSGRGGSPAAPARANLGPRSGCSQVQRQEALVLAARRELSATKAEAVSTEARLRQALESRRSAYEK